MSSDPAFGVRQRVLTADPVRLGKGKKLSVDFGTLGKAFMPESPRGPSEKSGQSSMVPSVIISRLVVFTTPGPWYLRSNPIS